MRDANLNVTRRRVMLAALAAGACGACQREDSRGATVQDVSQIEDLQVARIARPNSSAEVSALLRTWHGAICIGGGRYSMGGQIANATALHLDMRQMRALIALDLVRKTVRVQAGISWRQLLDYLDPFGLSVQIMQSYANFSVGGSVSVNCHGRYVGKGAVAHSVTAITLVMADGQILEANRLQHAALFAAAIGGYGGVGIITEVELELADNTPMQRSVVFVPLNEYPEWFAQHVLVAGTVASPNAVLMHNADLIPPDFDQPLATSWHQTIAPPNVVERLRARHATYAKNQNEIWAASELPGVTSLRQRERNSELNQPAPIVWRNYEASLDVASLEPRTRTFSTYLLQEYFVPVPHFSAFALGLQQVLRQAGANVLNISIRHAPPDTLTLMRWAPSEVFCFVLYFKQRNTLAADAITARWTRQLIDLALRFGGRYYLPYRLHASLPQFKQAYPEHREFLALKRSVDPNNRFRNQLWDKYLS